MKQNFKIVRNNVLVLLGFSIIFGICDWNLGSLILYAIIISIDVIANLILSIVYFTSRDGEREREKAKYYLLSAGLILLIGFSSCYVFGVAGH